MHKTRFAFVLAGLLVCSANAFAMQSVLGQVAAEPDKSARCDGPIAQKTRQLWDTVGNAYAQKTLKQRLVEKGDTYVLYDLQIQFHNFLAMAERCGDVIHLRQMAYLAQIAYTRLERDAPGSQRRHWVCRGGAVCNSVNRLVNTEVMLTSVQFLAFAVNTANALHAHANASAEDKLFALQTSQVAAEHLLRWGDAKTLKALQASQKATLEDVSDGSSRYFLTDRVLWQLSVFAHLAGMLQRDAAMFKGLDLSQADLQQLRTHAAALAALVQRRTQLTTVALPDGTSIQVGDLDAGYWRHYKDNRYAAYEGAEKPAVCVAGPNETMRAVVKLQPETVPLRNDIGWDLSHARRLVQFFEAIENNRASLQSVWKVSADLLPSQAVMQGFAQKLLSHVWNQDAKRPLFANYLSGANGWYRVAYDNGTGQCREGFPPFGMTDAFPTGGYATWGQWLPQLRTLGWQLFSLAESTDPDDQAFMTRYYRGLTSAASANVLMDQQLIFWPTLITKR